MTLSAGGILAATVFAGPAQAQSANLLTNPGFETGSLSGWSCDAGTATVATSPVHSGSYALQGTPSSSDDAQCTQTVTVTPDTTYPERLRRRVLRLPRRHRRNDTWTPSATSWQQLSTTYTTTASQTSLQVYLHGWYGQPAYYADDLALTSGSGLPTSSPTPTSTPTPRRRPRPHPRRPAAPRRRRSAVPSARSPPTST
ncbi:hypothetical protein GXW82_18890 [Streptacidiphilus sp. 4-A2]|nr:hypothetical protein [Streptacidiphilus sp. 4-A2]